jgi:hypothetical protein
VTRITAMSEAAMDPKLMTEEDLLNLVREAQLAAERCGRAPECPQPSHSPHASWSR